MSDRMDRLREDEIAYLHRIAEALEAILALMTKQEEDRHG